MEILPRSITCHERQIGAITAKEKCGIISHFEALSSIIDLMTILMKISCFDLYILFI